MWTRIKTAIASDNEFVDSSDTNPRFSHSPIPLQTKTRFRYAVLNKLMGAKVAHDRKAITKIVSKKEDMD